MHKLQYLAENADILRGRVVLDLACHTGASTQCIIDNGCESALGVDIRPELIEQARASVTGPAEFYVGNITDSNLIPNLVGRAQAVVCLGVLYHLYNHFDFLSLILQPHIEHVIIETEFGPESLNPEMFWGFENTSSKWHGWNDRVNIIPHGSPNLSWILNSAEIFGFGCDWLRCFSSGSGVKPIKEVTHEEYVAIAGPDWPPFQALTNEETLPDFVKQEINQMLGSTPAVHRRMIFRLYNRDRVQSTSLALKDIYRWPYN